MLAKEHNNLTNQLLLLSSMLFPIGRDRRRAVAAPSLLAVPHWLLRLVPYAYYGDIHAARLERQNQAGAGLDALGAHLPSGMR